MIIAMARLLYAMIINIQIAMISEQCPVCHDYCAGCHDYNCHDYDSVCHDYHAVCHDYCHGCHDYNAFAMIMGRCAPRKGLGGKRAEKMLKFGKICRSALSFIFSPLSLILKEI